MPKSAAKKPTALKKKSDRIKAVGPDLFVVARSVPPKLSTPELSSVEICAGAGGQALGLENAGFSHAALIELEAPACATIRANRPAWNVVEGDVHAFSGKPFKGVDLFAGGVPCPPFSKAGKQLGTNDERDLFPEALRLVDEIRLRAVMLENVRGLLDPVFADYRLGIERQLEKFGYKAQWKILNASDFGVPQLRPRVILVALKGEFADRFAWPVPHKTSPLTVGRCLHDLMAERGWRVANRWAQWADTIAPTLVGGSKKHGGPDLGPTRARKAWAALCVDGLGLADEAPEPGFIGFPRLTTKMTARLQGFPDTWRIIGKKTAAYRQIGNAFPAPVAEAVGAQIRLALTERTSARKQVAAA